MVHFWGILSLPCLQTLLSLRHLRSGKGVPVIKKDVAFVFRNSVLTGKQGRLKLRVIHRRSRVIIEGKQPSKEPKIVYVLQIVGERGPSLIDARD